MIAGKSALAILALGFAAFLSGCSSGFVPARNGISLEDGLLTGGKTEDGRNITTASDDGTIQLLKNKIRATATNVKLAKAIQALSVTTTDRDGKTVSANPERLKISIQLDEAYAQIGFLNFDVPLKANQGVPEFKNYAAKDSTAFQLSGQCATSACQKVVLHLEHDLGVNRDAQAGMVYRYRGAKGRATGKADRPDLKVAPRLQELHSSLRTNKVAGSLTTMEVVWGLSKFAIQIGSDAQKLCLSGILVQTNDADEPVRSESCDGKTAALRVLMLGNDGAGSILVKVHDAAAELIMMIVADGDAIVTEDPGTDGEVPPPIITGKSFLPIDPSNPISKIFEKDRKKPEVEAEIKRVWLENRRESMRNFLTRIQPNLSVLTENLSRNGVPNEFIIVTLIESRFFIDPNYPVEVTADPRSSATGPWQIVDTTAPELGIKHYPTKKGKDKYDYHECDERAYLKESTAAAGRYFARFLKKFNDPRLAVMAYHDGARGVGRHMEAASKLLKKRLDDANKNGLDFWVMYKMNVFPREKNGYRNYGADYVIKFLAGQFVARDPERYSLSPVSYEAIGSPGPAPLKPKKCS